MDSKIKELEEQLKKANKKIKKLEKGLDDINAQVNNKMEEKLCEKEDLLLG